MNNPLYSALFSIFLYSTSDLAVFAQSKSYQPPPSNRHTQQTRVQTSRSPSRTDVDFELLAPRDYIATTSLEKPVFFLEIYKITQNTTLDLAVESSNKVIWSNQVGVDRLGVIPIRIDTPLPPGRHILSVAYNCPTECKGIRIAFDIKPLSSEQVQKLAKMSIEQQSDYLRGMGYDYDSIRLKAQDHPLSDPFTFNPLD